MQKPSVRSGTLYAGIFLISAAILMLELTLTRVLSLALWYHFAFLVVALALLGLAISGVSVAIWPRLSRPGLLGVYGLLFAATAAGSIILFTALPHLLRSTVLPNQEQTIALVLTAATPVLFVVPFTLGGFCITVVLARAGRRAGRLYAADLAGASAGCLAVVPLFPLLGGPGVVLATAAVGSAAAVFFAWPERRRIAWLATAAFVILSGTALVNARLDLIRVGFVKGDFEAVERTYEGWNVFSRVMAFRTDVDTLIGLTIDGNAATLLYDDKSHGLDYWRYNVRGMPHVIKPDGRVLIVGPGGGGDVLAALTLGQREVTAVEINPLIVDVANRIHGDLTGHIYSKPGVRLIVDDGRSAINRSTERFDLIQLSFVDTWAATAAGAFALTENNLYTREAFRLYLERLTPDGILYASRWYVEGHPEELLRLTGLARAALADLGIDDPGRHVMLMRKDDFGLLVIKRSPLTEQDVARAENAMGAGMIFAPGRPAEPLFAELLTTPNPARFYADFPLDVSPPTDDRPFFFQTTRLDRAGFARWWAGPAVDVVSPVLLLLASVLSVGVLTLFLVVLPLIVRGRSLAVANPSSDAALSNEFDLPAELVEVGRPAGLGPSAQGRSSMVFLLGYFACLGAGFMLIEVTLLQKFTLVLGQPIYSLAVSLCTILWTSGVGSYLTRGISDAKLWNAVAWRVAALTVLCLVYAWGLGGPLEIVGGWRLVPRILAVAALIAPMGLLLGGLMPIGLRLMSARGTQPAAWAWGLNGAMSVLGSNLALIIALAFGFSINLIIAAGVYIAGAALLSKVARQRADSPAPVLPTPSVRAAAVGRPLTPALSPGEREIGPGE